jgi:hypothetical protein
MADPASPPGQQGVVGYPVEALRQGKLHGYLGARFEVALYLPPRLVGGPPWPKAAACRGDLRVTDRPPPRCARLLEDPLDVGGSAPQPLARSVPRRHLRAPDRGRLVRLVS